ncbi:alpha/beta hydrolase fold domain-containing protein [Dactylosporangium sp. NPDC049140]|uniref:alpha/beta hydrolase fold domain-containing protein n=1 Tax=Dactylosporangium sp. NPDC049140 TaxID=3155647 RepID=UPI0033FBD28C
MLGGSFVGEFRGFLISSPLWWLMSNARTVSGAFVAGGGLTVTTTLAARTAGLPMPGAIVAFSPGLDHTRSGVSMDTKAGLDPFFTREGMAHTGDLYLAGQDPNQELLTPAVLTGARTAELLPTRRRRARHGRMGYLRDTQQRKPVSAEATTTAGSGAVAFADRKAR